MQDRRCAGMLQHARISSAPSAICKWHFCHFAWGACPTLSLPCPSQTIFRQTREAANLQRVVQELSESRKQAVMKAARWVWDHDGAAGPAGRQRHACLAGQIAGWMHLGWSCSASLACPPAVLPAVVAGSSNCRLPAPPCLLFQPVGAVQRAAGGVPPLPAHRRPVALRQVRPGRLLRLPGCWMPLFSLQSMVADHLTHAEGRKAPHA